MQVDHPDVPSFVDHVVDLVEEVGSVEGIHTVAILVVKYLLMVRND